MDNTALDLKKAAVAYELADELMNIGLDLERAEIVLQEITDIYFGEHDPTTEEGRSFIVWEHRRHEIFAEIVTEYLFKIRKSLAWLSELKDAGIAMLYRAHRTRPHKLWMMCYSRR